MSEIIEIQIPWYIYPLATNKKIYTSTADAAFYQTVHVVHDLLNLGRRYDMEFIDEE